MALRIGKKNNADDWSEESLKQELAQISEDDAPATPAASDDPLADLLDDPAFSAQSTPAAVAAPLSDAPAAKARLSPVVLAAGLVFLIVAIGVGAFLMLFSKPAEDESVPTMPARVVKRPALTKPPVAVKPAPVVKVAPKPLAKPVTPGKAGLVAPGAKKPIVAPKKPGQAPRVAPVAGVPTPVVPPRGLAGQPGKGSTRDTTVEVVHPVGVLTPAIQARLKALWKKGANAKHKGNYAAARAAWEEMLKVRPGHPGVQEAINQLPK